MPLVRADEFMANLALFRVLTIRGRLGGGKTLGAVAIAHELHKRKFVEGVVANFPCALPLPDWRSKRGRDCCCIFDEAWQLLDNRTSMSNPRSYGAFARKLGQYWLFPSVIPLDKRVSYLMCEREARYKVPVLYSLIRLLLMIPFVRVLLKPVAWLGDEIWVYRWSVELGYIKEEGTFWLTRPGSYFEMYDNLYIPLSDAGLSALWQVTVEQIADEDIDDESIIRQEVERGRELPTSSNELRTKVRILTQELQGTDSGGE